jgi:glycosyltransferase involved in cell wall biosynthesis
MNIRVCFLGGARFGRPLDATNAKKFQRLRALAELFVIGFSQNFRPQRFSENAQFYLLPKLPLPILRYAEMLLLGPLLACWLIVWHKVHVLVVQSPYEGFAAAWAKKLAGWLGHRVVLVVESHGDFEESLFLQRRILIPRLFRFLMRRAARFALNSADLFRAISNSTRHQLLRWAPGKPVCQFPTWTDIEVFLREDARNKEQPSQNILYAGVLIPRKGVHHLISTFARIAPDFPQAKLLIIGREENKDYAMELKKESRHSGLDGRVQFVSEISQAELAVWMRRACVFVLPSTSEGLGRVVVEAMATGTPVIGSNVGGIPEIIENGVTGLLVPPGDEKSIEESLRWVLTHPEESAAMGIKARERAKEIFSAEAYVEGYRRTFEEAKLKIQKSSKVKVQKWDAYNTQN